MTKRTKATRAKQPPLAKIAEFPCYSLADAARYLGLPRSTVRDWTLGAAYPTTKGTRASAPIVFPADPENRLLSFENLIELHVLSALRRSHRVTLERIRRAVFDLQVRLKCQRPLLAAEMLTDDVDIFVEHLGTLVAASNSGQLAVKELLSGYLRRIDRNPSGVPVRLYLFSRDRIATDPRLVAIELSIGFGRPCIATTGIPTAAILERYRAGESAQDLATDYNRPIAEIEEAIRFEYRPASA